MFETDIYFELQSFKYKSMQFITLSSTTRPSFDFVEFSTKDINVRVFWSSKLFFNFKLIKFDKFIKSASYFSYSMQINYWFLSNYLIYCSEYSLLINLNRKPTLTCRLNSSIVRSRSKPRSISVVMQKRESHTHTSLLITCLCSMCVRLRAFLSNSMVQLQRFCC